MNCIFCQKEGRDGTWVTVDEDELGLACVACDQSIFGPARARHAAWVEANRAKYADFRARVSAEVEESWATNK